MEILPAAAVPAPPDREAPAFERPARSAAESFSIGPTNAGALVGAMALPTDHEALRPRPRALARGAIHGTPALVHTLIKAATRVAREHSDSVLWAGDLSLAAGGALPPHRSHTNGRDADLAFYVSRPRDGRLEPADGPEMRHIGRNGRVVGTDLVFDPARNWALVQALLEDPGATPQWLFVADHLRALLLAEGRRVAPPWLVERAERVLVEPSDSSPHADHFHLRIYCGLAERLEGCLDAPPIHPWAPRYDAELARWLDGLLPFLTTPREPETREAITRIVRMNATNALPYLDRLTRQPLEPGLAKLVADARDFLSGRRTPSAWRRWRPDDAP